MSDRLRRRIAIGSCALALAWWSCAKLQSTLPTQPAASPHGAGWADTSQKSSAAFHGTYLRLNGIHVDSCNACHASDFTATGSGASCSRSGCHIAADNGPLACYNCHGDRAKKTWYPPRALNDSISISYVGVGQHTNHMFDTTLTTRVYDKCTTCHLVPQKYFDAGHRTGTGAAITFGDSLAFKQTNVVGGYKRDTTRGVIVPAPQWNATTMTCENVYCHGYFRNGNLTNAPSWTGNEQDACGTCHGDPATGSPLPGGTHKKNPDCNSCHSAVVDVDNKTIINRSLHIDGKIEVDDNLPAHDVW